MPSRHEDTFVLVILRSSMIALTALQSLSPNTQPRNTPSGLPRFGTRPK
jgi:hypothetical protein